MWDRGSFSLHFRALRFFHEHSISCLSHHLAPGDQQLSRMTPWYFPSFLNSVLKLESRGKSMICVLGCQGWGRLDGNITRNPGSEASPGRQLKDLPPSNHQPKCQPFYLGAGPQEPIAQSLASKLRAHFLALLELAHPYRVTRVVASDHGSLRIGKTASDRLGSCSVSSSLSHDLSQSLPLSGPQSPPWTRQVASQLSTYFMEYQHYIKILCGQVMMNGIPLLQDYVEPHFYILNLPEGTVACSGCQAGLVKAPHFITSHHWYSEEDTPGCARQDSL